VLCASPKSITGMSRAECVVRGAQHSGRGARHSPIFFRSDPFHEKKAKLASVIAIAPMAVANAAAHVDFK
jgi:hypothetical protein